MPDEGILTREDNEAAAAFVRDKARTNIRIFGDMLPETRAHAFAVAGIEEMRRLKQVQDAIARVPEGGDWKEAREEIAAALGDPEKNAARAETVLRTNCFQAYAAARYRSQMEDKEVFPYLKYVTVGDSRVRDSHAQLNGTILPKDDPFWQTHYPPWDWGCRCVAVELTEEMAREEQADGTGSVRDEGWSQDYRAAHRGRDESKDYQFRPGSLSIALDDAALKRAAGRHDEERPRVDVGARAREGGKAVARRRREGWARTRRRPRPQHGIDDPAHSEKNRRRPRLDRIRAEGRTDGGPSAQPSELGHAAFSPGRDFGV